MSKSLPLLAYNPWSPSKADLAGTCSLAFKLRYIDKVEGGPRGTAAKVGVAAHRAQELVLEGKEVSEAMEQAIDDCGEDLTHSEVEKTRSFTSAIVDFKNKIDAFASKHPVKEFFLEQKWAITPDFTPCDFFDKSGMIRGVVDFGMLLESGHLIVIDHKTGRKRPLDYYGTQLDVYAVMGRAYFPDIEGVQCAVNFLAHDTVDWAPHKKASYVGKVLHPWLTNYLNNRASKVEGFEARTGRHCSWCDYKALCPTQVTNGQSGEDNS